MKPALPHPVKKSKKIDLEKSFINFISSLNSHRANIKSILTYENNSLFLVKECRAELMGEKPFYQTGRYEYLAIEDNYGTSVFRTYSLDYKKTNLKYQSSTKNKKNILISDIKYLSFNEVYEIVSSNNPTNVFCEIEYEFENKKYNLITKCEYINYNSDKSEEKYLQPIMGYVPFVLNNIISYGYVVLYVKKDGVNGNLEFLISEKSSLFTIGKNENIIIKLIKLILNNLLFFYKKNEFSKYISLENSKIYFFKYY
jgi:hypothetical protein